MRNWVDVIKTGANTVSAIDQRLKPGTARLQDQHGNTWRCCLPASSLKTLTCPPPPPNHTLWIQLYLTNAFHCVCNVMLLISIINLHQITTRLMTICSSINPITPNQVEFVTWGPIMLPASITIKWSYTTKFKRQRNIAFEL